MRKNKVYGYKGKYYKLKKKFVYTGTEQEFTLDKGRYLLVCNGARGGSGYNFSYGYDYETILPTYGNDYGYADIKLSPYVHAPSLGGTSIGVLNVETPQTLYAVVGGNGGNAESVWTRESQNSERMKDVVHNDYLLNGGYNGGGGGGCSITWTDEPTGFGSTGQNDMMYCGAGGGGATDIRTMKPTKSMRTVTKKRLPDEYQELEYITSYKPTEDETPIDDGAGVNDAWRLTPITLNYVPKYETTFDIDCMFYSNVEYSDADMSDNWSNSPLFSSLFQDWTGGSNAFYNLWMFVAGPISRKETPDKLGITFSYGDRDTGTYGDGDITNYRLPYYHSGINIKPDEKITIKFRTNVEGEKDNLYPYVYAYDGNGDYLTHVRASTKQVMPWKNSIKPLVLFGDAVGDSIAVGSVGFYGRFYQMKIYEGDELVRHYIPCYNKSAMESTNAINIVGVYDLITDTFMHQEYYRAAPSWQKKTVGPEIDTMVTFEEEYDPSLYSRFIVAGGGGGCPTGLSSYGFSSGTKPYDSNDGCGAIMSGSTHLMCHGGGVCGSGLNRNSGSYSRASQTDGYAFGFGQNAQRQNQVYESNWRPVCHYDYGSETKYFPRLPGYGGGGGGWFGGKSNDDVSVATRGGAGGSGYVLTEDSYKPEGYLVGEEFYLSDVLMIGGNSQEPSIEIYEEIDTLSTDDELCLYCTGETEEFTFPKGTYKIKCYGPGGAAIESINQSSKGGYSEGVLSIDEPKTLYLTVGGVGYGMGEVYDEGFSTRTFNGGGRTDVSPSYAYQQRSGGGATDIRTMKPNGELDDPSLYSRFIVAGGGGGQTTNTFDKMSSAGGGLEGNISINPDAEGTSSYVNTDGSIVPGPGTQTGSATYDENPSICGGFGFGGRGVLSITDKYGYQFSSAGGGGGWFGGSGTLNNSSTSWDSTYQGASGGSGYVLTEDSYKPEGYLVGEEFYLSDTKLVTGGNTLQMSQGLIEIDFINMRAPIICHDNEGYKYFDSSTCSWTLITNQELTIDTFNEYGSFEFVSDNGLLDSYDICLYDETDVLTGMKFEVVPIKQSISITLPIEYKNDKILIDHDNPDSRYCSVTGRKRMSNDRKNLIYDIDVSITEDVRFPVRIFGLEVINVGGRSGSKSYGTGSKIVEVPDYFSMFDLTTDDVNLGDIVKDLETGDSYVVIDLENLNNAMGYGNKPKQELIDLKTVDEIEEFTVGNRPSSSGVALYDRMLVTENNYHFDLRSNDDSFQSTSDYAFNPVIPTNLGESDNYNDGSYGYFDWDTKVKNTEVYHPQSICVDDDNIYVLMTDVCNSTTSTLFVTPRENGYNGAYMMEGKGIPNKNSRVFTTDSYGKSSVSEKKYDALKWLDETTLIACGDDHIILFDTVTRTSKTLSLDGSMTHERFDVGNKLIVGANKGSLNCYDIKTGTITTIELPEIDASFTRDVFIKYYYGIFYIIYPDGRVLSFDELSSEVLEILDVSEYMVNDGYINSVNVNDGFMTICILISRDCDVLVYDINSNELNLVDTSEDVYSSIANSVKTYVFKGYLIFYKNGGVSMFKIGDMGESRIGFINENTILRIEDLNYECNTDAVMIKSNKLTIRHEIIEKSFDVINTNIKKISMNKSEYTKLIESRILNR